ncbi:DUF4054 domain-containing protein [Sphingomonas koreensis]
MPYAVPTVAEFRERFPAFAAVPDARVQYWLDHHDPVTTDWIEGDYQNAILELTAHNLVVNDEVPGSGQSGDMAGVTRFRSASMDVSFSEKAANAGLDGEYDATKYGQRFKIYLRRSMAGPRLVGCR